MAVYAKIKQGTVIDAIVADADFMSKFVDTSPGTWILVPSNQNCCIGGFYDAERNLFSPKPLFESWTWNKETNEFEPPIPMPTDELEDQNFYQWDEQNQKWNLIKRKI